MLSCHPVQSGDCLTYLNISSASQAGVNIDRNKLKVNHFIVSYLEHIKHFKAKIWNCLAPSFVLAVILVLGVFSSNCRIFLILYPSFISLLKRVNEGQLVCADIHLKLNLHIIFI